MAFLNIYFADLIAYVPGTTTNPFTVLLPDTPPTSPHTPYLIFRTSDYSSGYPGLLFGGRGIFKAWQLAGETLMVPHGENALKLGSTVNDDEVWESPVDDRFFWTTKAPMLHQTAGNGKVRRTCLSQGLGVTAKMELTHGTMTAIHFATQESDQKTYRYKFKEGHTSSRAPDRVLVNATVCRIEINQPNPIQIVSNHYTGAPKRYVTLQNASGSVDVAVVNLGKVEQGHSKTEHFLNYYPLIDNWNDLDYLPELQSGTGLVNGPDLPIFLSQIKTQLPIDVLLDREACPHVILDPP